MANDSGASLVLSTSHYDFSGLNTHIVFQQIKPDYASDIDTLLSPIIQQPLAYIMFTSGSSGKPKAVGITKIQVNHYLQLALKEHWWKISAQDRFLQAFELSFDASVQWLFMPLAIGACIYVPDSGGNKSMNIAKCLMEHAITFAMMPPTVLQVLKPYLPELHFPQLRYSLFGGEVLNVATAIAWSYCAPNAIIENHYGPTEATIWCTRHIIDKDKLLNNQYGTIIPIGIPHTGIDAILIDKETTAETIGELCVNGTQVINKYLNAVNTERFITIDNKTYYRTGDWVERIDGQYYFKGRIDNQLKVSGYRIEPEEIEHAITSITKHASFVAISTKHNGLLAALIESSPFSELEIKAILRKKLPIYMLPSLFIYTESIPINANGKINRAEALKILENQPS
jgi:acyl-coenzyme A synthetase/AMP-(fatty) acid ligase